MTKKIDYWKKNNMPKLIDEKSLEAFIKKNNGEVTIEDIEQEAEIQLSLILRIFEDKYCVLNTPSAYTTITWIYYPETYKQLMKVCVPASSKPLKKSGR